VTASEHALPERADIVVVGGGSAGCVVAARISEDPRNRVVLLEAGDDIVPDRPPADIADLYPRSAANPSYFSELTATIRRGNRPVIYTQPKILGGGSSVMGMWALRGLAADYDSWAAGGAVGWSWSEVEPYFKKLERELQKREGHGFDGPVPIRTYPADTWPGFTRALATAAANQGAFLRDDLTVDERDGVYPVPVSADTRRSSTAYDYLSAEVRARPNLRIITSVSVKRFVFDHSRLTGIVVKRGNEEKSIQAAAAVLCAGAIHSPLLLMASGIGSQSDLDILGVTPTYGNAAVGGELQNHVFAQVGAVISASARQNPANRAYVMALERLTSPFQDSPPADMMLSFIARISAHRYGSSIGLVGVHLNSPLSRGRVRASGPTAAPCVEFNLLEDEADRARMVWGVRRAATLLADPAVAAISADPFLAPRKVPARLLNQPGLRSQMRAVMMDAVSASPSSLRRRLLQIGVPGVAFLDQIPNKGFEDAVMSVAGPMFHVAGTCGIGRVVDAGLNVVGVENLWIADASVMPSVPRANTNLPTIMIAERGSDLIKQALRKT
jgi:5-(hydroxymethyl)furfural/furfural oxidase